MKRRFFRSVQKPELSGLMDDTALKEDAKRSARDTIIFVWPAMGRQWLWRSQ